MNERIIKILDQKKEMAERKEESIVHSNTPQMSFNYSP